jgi:hypothetical protein
MTDASMRAWVCFAAVMLPTASSAVAPELKRMATTVRMKPAMSAARAPVLKMQYGHDQQGWATAVDDNYYYDEQQGYTGQYNEQQGHNGQLLWNLAGNSGVRGFSPAGLLPADYHQQDYRFLPYSLRNGQEQLLSRWNMVRQKPTVSRMQCSVAVSPDGVATLTSYGKGPTLWRQQHGYGWVALYNGDQVILSEGDQIGLDWHDPEAAVFTCYATADNGMGYDQYGQQQQPQQQQQGGYSEHNYPQEGYDQGYYGKQQPGYPNRPQEGYNDQYYGEQQQGGYMY